MPHARTALPDGDASRRVWAPLTDAERSKLPKLIPIRDSNADGHGHPDQIRYTITAGDHTAARYGEDAQIRQRVLALC
jgi:hypothetical protein